MNENAYLNMLQESSLRQEGKTWDKVKKVWRDHKGKIIAGAGLAAAVAGGLAYRNQGKIDKASPTSKTAPATPNVSFSDKKLDKANPFPNPKKNVAHSDKKLDKASVSAPARKNVSASDKKLDKASVSAPARKNVAYSDKKLDKASVNAGKKSVKSSMSDIRPRTHPSARGAVRAAYGWKVVPKWDKKKSARNESLNQVMQMSRTII